MPLSLTPERGLVFRITHRDIVPWILLNGLHCASSAAQDPDFRPIGNPALIDKRMRRVVPIAPGGVLSEYIPFYFTPHSIMLLNTLDGAHKGAFAPERLQHERLALFGSDEGMMQNLAFRELKPL